MVKVTVKKIGKPYKAPDLKKATQDALDEEAEWVLQQYQRIVSTWKKKPKFEVERKSQSRIVQTGNDIFRYLDEGTKPHDIEARNAKTLAFPTVPPFKAKTSPAFGSRAGVQPNSEYRFPKKVRHPGINGRSWTPRLAERSRKRFQTTLRRHIKKQTSRKTSGR